MNEDTKRYIKIPLSKKTGIISICCIGIVSFLIFQGLDYYRQKIAIEISDNIMGIHQIFLAVERKRCEEKLKEKWNENFEADKNKLMQRVQNFNESFGTKRNNKK